MTRSGSAAELENRIRQRAHLLWVEEGRPEGREIEYRAKARELIAIEDNQGSATVPRPRGQHARAPGGEPVEPVAAVENQGEFPGLADQGEESTIPKRPRDRA